MQNAAGLRQRTTARNTNSPQPQRRRRLSIWWTCRNPSFARQTSTLRNIIGCFYVHEKGGKQNKAKQKNHLLFKGRGFRLSALECTGWIPRPRACRSRDLCRLDVRKAASGPRSTGAPSPRMRRASRAAQRDCEAGVPQGRLRWLAAVCFTLLTFGRNSEEFRLQRNSVSPSKPHP